MPSPTRHAHMTRPHVALVVAFLAILLLPGSASAHSEFVSGTPASGSSVASGPIDVVGTFSEPLDPKSHMELLDSAGTVVAHAAVDGDTMRIGLESLQPGQYEVRWTSVAEDGDVLRSTGPPWVFTVAATSSPSESPAASPPASAPPSPPASVVPTPVPSATNNGQSGASTTDLLLPIVAAIVAIALLGLTLLRRRSRAGL